VLRLRCLRQLSHALLRLITTVCAFGAVKEAIFGPTNAIWLPRSVKAFTQMQCAKNNIQVEQSLAETAAASCPPAPSPWSSAAGPA
jgi:hypothetical protein